MPGGACLTTLSIPETTLLPFIPESSLPDHSRLNPPQKHTRHSSFTVNPATLIERPLQIGLAEEQLLYRILQGFASLESRAARCADLDGGARLWVAPGARRTLLDRKSPEAD